MSCSAVFCLQRELRDGLQANGALGFWTGVAEESSPVDRNIETFPG